MNVINRLICFKFYKCSNIKIINNFAWANKITDCNDAVNNNVIYAVDGFAKNRPATNTTYFTIWTHVWDSNNITKFASTFGPSIEIYCRKKSSNGWGTGRNFIMVNNHFTTKFDHPPPFFPFLAATNPLDVPIIIWHTASEAELS